MNLKEKLLNIAKEAKEAAGSLFSLATDTKNEILKDASLSLLSRKAFIIKANEKDIRLARAAKKPKAFIDRLCLNEKRIKEMSDSLLEIA
ncbi:MAG: gamma-glutamyl-phosphate reductase, partial [Candidatus Omnitrophota bacterium]